MIAQLFERLFLLLHLVGRYLADAVVQSDLLCTYDVLQFGTVVIVICGN